MIPNARSEYSEHYFREYHSVIPKSTYPIAWSYYNLLPSHWLAIWRIIRRSPLSEENYPNRNPAWKQALLITDFQGNTRKGSSTSLSEENYPNRNPAWKQALLIADFQGDTRKGSSTSLSGTSLQAQTGVPRSEED